MATAPLYNQGNFVYHASTAITVSAAKIYRTGSTLSFTINNCQKNESSTATSTPQLMTFARRDDGYEVTVNLNATSALK